MATISQRISLEGSDDIRKKLEALGVAGEKAFKQIQDAAKKPITDPAQVDKTKQAFDQLSQAVTKLGPQFQQLTGNTQAFGTAGAKASQDTTSGLNQTAAAAEKTGAGFKNAANEANNLGIRIGVVAGLVAAATNKLIGVLGQLRAALSPGELLKGTVETGKAISDQADKLKLTVPEWLKLSKAIADAGVSEEKFIKGTKKLAGIIDDAKGGFVELVPGQLVSTSKGAVAVLRDLAESIARLGNETEQARQGRKLFGEDWKEIVKALTGAKKAADDADDVFDKLAKVDRAMRPDQAERAAQLAKGWDVLAKAMRALRDQIGTVFLEGGLFRAEWLIKLLDVSRELFKTWQQLADEGKKAFLEGLGDSPAEFLFKTLIALTEQLSGIWRDVLVPVGEKLMGIFRGIADGLQGVSASQVAAGFITLTAAAVGLGLALKAVEIALAPIALLLSPFGLALVTAGAAAALFWDQISAGAAKAGALIPVELQDIGDAFKKLFAGDFAGFWDQFSTAAVAAFKKISAAILENEGPLGSLARGLVQIGKEAPATILLVAKAFITLGDVATTVANTINNVFGTELTGTSVAAIVIIGQMTGAFQLLAAAATIVGVAFGVLATIVGGVWAAAIVAAGVIIFELIRKWDDLKAHAIDCFTNIGNGIDWLKGKISDLASQVSGAIWDAWKATGGAAIDWIGNKIDWLIGKLKEAAAWVGSLFGGGGTPGETTPTPGFARGGMIGGRGSGTSDSNLAWVSRGEHIMPARAVAQPGVLAFLEALRRSGGDLSRVLDRMGHFATGGLVGMPALAGGGLGGMHPVTIQFPGMPAVTGLRASSDVVDELRKAAAMAQVRSGGRKPSRYT